MKIAYLDCFSGISGDMCLGALVDAGVPLRKLLEELKKIPLKGYEIHVRKVKRAGISATKADVLLRAKSIERRAKSNPTPLIPPLGRGDKEGFKLRTGGVKSNNPPNSSLEKWGVEGFEPRAKRWKDIEKIIHKSSLTKGTKDKGLKVFETLFKAEAKIHGDTFERVHLHELGAVDCLVDVFGTIIGFDILEAEKIFSSPVNLGGGSVKTEHGILHVPAPASAEILKGVPVYATDTNFELTTPTGAVLVKELSSEFGGLPLMNIEHTGFGAGNMNFKDRPNILRLFIGNMLSPSLRKPNPPTPPLEKLYSPSLLWQRGVRGDLKEELATPPDEMATVIEANIDDMNPQIYEHVIEKLFKKGALDVFLTQIIMKKGRPGIKLTALCKETEKENLIKIILTETTTIGLRFREVKRRVLQRDIQLVDTEFGKVRVKFSKLENNILKITPEYEDCKRIANKLNLPLIEIMRRIRIPSSTTSKK